MKKLVVFLLLIVLGVIIVACADDTVTVAIVEGSIPLSFNVDEAFPEDAKIAVTTGGTTEEKAITLDMVEGFDTSLSTGGEQKTMTIRYEEQTLTHTYTVLGEVNTLSRLTATTEKNGNEVIVTISTKNLSATDGLYAIGFTATANSTAVALKEKTCLADGYAMQWDQRVAIYADGGDRIVADTAIVKLVYVKSNTQEIELTIGGENGYIVMVDKPEDGAIVSRYLPPLTIKI